MKRDFEKAGKLRSEFVIAVTGTVEKRGGAVNENLATGAIELRAESLRILAESDVPAVPDRGKQQDKRRDSSEISLSGSSKTGFTEKYHAEEQSCPADTVNSSQRKVSLKSKHQCLVRVLRKVREITLFRPEFIRGSFYGLPQSPQLYKQLLMCSGYDRYIQIARCFRDEDLRADRQPEFTQIDMELSFVDVDDVIDVNERFLAYLFKEVLDVDVKLPIQRITWQEAMDRFGSDKPDMRFGMELHDVSEVVRDCDFVVFKSALENGGSVRGINAERPGWHAS